jgi:hypothetical protein
LSARRFGGGGDVEELISGWCSIVMTGGFWLSFVGMLVLAGLILLLLSRVLLK